ncbi:cell surface protein SprA [Compostibacter hankyongensis]|uniref:Cell surface protein SprA n=1 Tax=Compostibacter hankyongensis TaxID=1007089 RepID=A0ABP8FFG3_9BACT
MARKFHFGTLAITGIVPLFLLSARAPGFRSTVQDAHPHAYLRPGKTGPGGRQTSIAPLLPQPLSAAVPDTTPALSFTDTLHFPIYDRRGDPEGTPTPSSIDLQDPPVIKRTVEYDPVTRQYRLEEKIGDRYYRKPGELDYQKFLQRQGEKDEQDYWMQRAGTMSRLNRDNGGPALYRGPLLFNRTFGGTGVDIRPQGNLNLTFGYEGSNTGNLILPENNRRQGGFNFDMDINMNVVGQIGSKLKLTSSYNTQSTFDFEKQIRLEYTGDDDEIIKKIEAGNVSFPLHSQLVTGIQSLFGIKAQLQFGRLGVTTVFSNQRSQKQNLMMEGGSQVSNFSIMADQYEENRHFLLAQYFHDHYNETMANLPVVSSQVHITRMEVWVTNKTGATINARDVVGLMDLGETKPYNGNIHPLTSNPLPENGANDEYQRLASDPSARNTGTVISRLQAIGLQPVQDFEKTFARKLDSTEYTYNDQVGFLSLRQQLQPDEVLGVAFQYTYNGRVFQVGEFSQDIPPDSARAQPQVIFLKLLKATSARTRLPIWQLMMKNIYATGAFQVSREDFRMDIFYQDPGSGDKRYLPDAQGPYEGRPLLSILNLDRLNSNNDPQPDGVFDFVDGFTINTQDGHIIFPVLQPFGKDLAKAFDGNSQLMQKYLFQVLYDSTKTIAQQFPQFNRYVMRGTYKGSSSSEISLGGLNIPPGSVTVTAGGQQLLENVDYVIDYSVGQLRIINPGVLNSGLPVNVQFESNAAFGQQTRNYFGARLDYYVNDKLTIGSSVIRMTERPYFSTVNYGEDPISNTIGGFDMNYRSELPGLNRWLDKLPNYKSSTASTINATGEVARLFPGHSKLIGKGDDGSVLIDDFEGARNSYDLKTPYYNWVLASTPQGATGTEGQELFPEATLTDSLEYGMNRGNLAWYTIEQSLVDGSNAPDYIRNDKQMRLGHYVRTINPQELFPDKRDLDFGQIYLSTFDLAYYPNERGPYNFSSSTSDVDANGRLLHPEKRWGGIMRAIDNTDFETSNVQYIEFWVMDPFLDNPTSSGGDLYINLGNISEDILRDGRKFFENGLPKPAETNKVDTSIWGRTPRFQQQITNAFDNDPAARAYQDVGYDGLDNNEETKYRQQYLLELMQHFGPNSKIYQDALTDPDNDDFHFYRGADYDQQKLSVLERYKRFNNSENNAPVASGKDRYPAAYSNRPETEDINNDNTLNETEEYFQYRIEMKPGMNVGDNFIVDKVTIPANDKNGPLSAETWYQFRVPIQSYNKKVGDIPDFKSIRFMRMFLTGFRDSAILRFAKLDLVRNQWRQYNYKLNTPPGQPPIPVDDDNTGTTFNISAVNLEENSGRVPIPYQIPPGVKRQQQLSANNVNQYLNEQSMTLKVCELQDGDARGVFKPLAMDLRQFRRMKMYIHAEEVTGQGALRDGDLAAIIRLGSDFNDNYYEYRIPLRVTSPQGPFNTATIWPDSNQLNIDLTMLPRIKQQRNQENVSPLSPYTVQDNLGNYITVVGNPNLGDVRNALIGILNPKKTDPNSPDDGLPKCAEIWVDEMRVSDMDEKGGYAAVGRVDMQLSDLGTVSVSGAMHTQGFGSVDQRINERFRDNYTQYDMAANLELGKLLPNKLGLSIPVYAGYSQTISNPEYDPYDLDIKLKDKLRLARSQHARDSIREQAQDFVAIKSFNITNMRKLPGAGKKNSHLWDIENFDLSYSFTQTMEHNPLIERDMLTNHRLGIGYNYAGQSRFITPFRNLLGGKSKYLDLIRDFNFNYVPSIISLRGEINRQFGATRVRNIGGGPYKIPETYDKYFTFDRYYTLKWDLTRSLTLDFTALNNSRIDEPYGRLNTPSKRDTVFNNLLNLGRTTMYHHTANLTYTLPLKKFPLLDWTNVRFGYATDYSWTAASRLALYLGNAIENSHQTQVNADLNFTALYNKSRFLREIAAPARPAPQKTGSNAKDKNSSDGISPVLRALIRPLLSLKRVTINYSENAATRLPGYVDSTSVLGQNWGSMAPGMKFLFGWQPNDAWLDDIGRKGWITHDSLFNLQYQQQYTKRLDAQASLEPFGGLRIDLSLTQSFSKTHSELFKDTTGSAGLAHLNPYDMGGFQISYISIKSLFGKEKMLGDIPKTFLDFENYRKVISKRLGTENPYTNGQKNPKDPDYYKGYGRYAQDVLIPAFLAAYTGRDPDKIGLLKNGGGSVRSNPFSAYKPLPNWRITYNGLSRLPFFSNFVTNMTLSHAYTSLLSMNSYNSSLMYADPLRYGYPGFIDPNSLSGDYIPYFLVPNITVTEQFAPLLGIEATFTNNLNVRFAYSKSRTLSLSLIDFQLAEMRSSEITVGGGFRVRNLSLPFNLGNGKKKLNNDLNFRIDLSFRDDKTVNNRLDADLIIPTSGQQTIGISPSIDYVVNDRLNLHFFYDRRQTIPAISSYFPQSNTQAGVTLRFVMAR